MSSKFSKPPTPLAAGFRDARENEPRNLEALRGEQILNPLARNANPASLKP